MSTELNTEWALGWIKGCAEIAREKREELIDLDRAIGDADHGENIDRGFSAVVDRLQQNPADTPQQVLKTTAQVLISSVGGASGPLLGTAFLRAAKTATTDTLDGAAIATLIEGALEGITTRGKATEGEKTMVDAWAPAATAARAAADEGKGAAEVLAAAATAAEDGADATVPMIATKGRASYLGERSRGHKDPGAASSAYFLRAAADAAQG